MSLSNTKHSMRFDVITSTPHMITNFLGKQGSIITTKFDPKIAREYYAQSLKVDITSKKMAFYVT